MLELRRRRSPPMFTTYLALAAAIALEVVGTTFLQKSEQFTKLVPTLLMAVFYLGAFWLLSFALRTMPVGVAYAIWSGMGIVLISLIGVFVFGQRLDAPAILGLGLIVLGVLVVNLFSKSVGH
ncbi:SMR family transporter [Falsirhodobacter xinxiangensis]|uniref:SMR family transporter n=1 Tax=Falsirhodobacter xinxiangensis TaxID=2530049 RepID=UPI0010AB31F4|nr:multidrug efflux SMR transporter [Rhodobacter xinxiangensis]